MDAINLSLPKSSYKIDDAGVLLVVKKIILNTSVQYDECLLYRFYEFIKSTKIIDVGELRPLTNALNKHLQHPSFVMVNQDAAFKTLESIVKMPRADENFETIKPCLISFWQVLPNVIINENFSFISAMLSLLKEIVCIQKGYLWILEQTISPPVKVDKFSNIDIEIKDIISLVRFFLKAGYNYHILKNCEQLLRCLVTLPCLTPNLYPTARELLLPVLRELFLEGNSSITHIIYEIYNQHPSRTNADYYQVLVKFYDLDKIAHESFDFLIEKPGFKMTQFCKCLAQIPVTQSIDHILKQLVRKDQPDAIIAYLSHSISMITRYVQVWLIYTLYPILAACVDSDHVVKKLVMKRSEHDFLDKHLDKKLTSFAIANLRKVIIEDPLNSTFSLHQSHTCHTLITETMFIYIKQHYHSMSSYKNVLECCSLLTGLSGLRNISKKSIAIKNTIRGLCDLLHEIFEKEYKISHVRLVVSELMKALIISYENQEEGCESKSICEKAHKLIFFIISKIKDDNDSDQIVNDLLILMQLEKFCIDDLINKKPEFAELIWNDLYPRYKNTDHPTLLGFLVALLLIIDVRAKSLTLDRLEIRRYHEVPIAVAETLLNKAGHYDTIERILHGLEHREESFDCTYVSRLDCPNLGITVRPGLDKLTCALCALIRFESRWTEPVLRLIIGLTKTVITNHDDNEKTIRRLVETDIIETLYQVATNDVETINSQRRALKGMMDIRRRILRTTLDSGKILLDSLVDHLSSIEEYGPDDADEIKLKATAIVDGYVELDIDSEIILRIKSRKFTNFDSSQHMEASSVVNEILSFGEGLCEDGMDCY